jgi:hypothetical protein
MRPVPAHGVCHTACTGCKVLRKGTPAPSALVLTVDGRGVPKTGPHAAMPQIGYQSHRYQRYQCTMHTAVVLARGGPFGMHDGLSHTACTHIAGILRCHAGTVVNSLLTGDPMHMHRTQGQSVVDHLMGQGALKIRHEVAHYIVDMIVITC